MSDTPDKSPNDESSLDELWVSRHSKQIRIPPNLLEQLRVEKSLKDSQQETYDRLRADGYKTYEESETITGTSKKTLSYKVNKLEPETDYLPTGLPVPEGYSGTTIKGNLIKWVDPRYSKTVLLHPAFVEGYKQAEDKRKSLQEAGYLDFKASVAKGCEPAQLGYCSHKVKPDEKYYSNGLKYDDDSTASNSISVLQGKELKWVHPYNGDVLFHPDLINALVETASTEKALREKGYKAAYEVAEELGIKDYLIRSKLQNIDPQKDYLPDGRDAPGTSGETTVKGSVLLWENPYSGENLIHPDFIHGIKERLALTDQWLRMFEASKELEVPHTLVISRLKTIEPKTYYTEKGLAPLGTEGEILIKGSDFTKRFGRTTTCVRRTLVDGWKEAEEEYKRLLADGYKTPKEAEGALKVTPQVISSWLSKYDPAKEYNTNGTPVAEGAEGTGIKGSQLVWRHPYNSNVLLLHPDLLTTRLEAEVPFRKGAPGAFTPLDAGEELDQQRYIRLPQAALMTGITGDAIKYRLRRYKADKYYDNKGQEVDSEAKGAIKGSDFTRQNPYSEKAVYVLADIIQAWVDGDKKFKKLKDSGYKTPERTAAITGLTKGAVNQRVLQIEDESYYTHDGKPLSQFQEDAIKGHDLYYKHPYSGDILISNDVVKGWQQAEAEYQKLLSKKYESLSSVAEKANVTSTAITVRLRGYDIDKDYPISCEPRDPLAEETIKGCDIYWKHPYARNEVLIHPNLASGWEKVENDQNSLIKKGYFTTEAAEDYTGLKGGTLSLRLKQYEPNEKYTPQGLPVRDSDADYCHGKDLVYRNPYNRNGILINPTLVKAWKTADDKAKNLISSGYRTQDQVIEYTGMSRSNIQKRTSSLRLSPKTADDSLIWIPPYGGGKGILYSPELVESWKTEREQAWELFQKGAVVEKVGDIKGKIPDDIDADLASKDTRKRKVR